MQNSFKRGPQIGLEQAQRAQRVPKSLKKNINRTLKEHWENFKALEEPRKAKNVKPSKAQNTIKDPQEIATRA